MNLIKFVTLFYCACYVNGLITPDLITQRSVYKYRRCDYKYYEVAAGWLKYHSYPATWSQARKRCQLEGANLASPTNMTSIAMMYLMETHTAENLYTGINDLISPGDFVTIEGMPVEDYSIPHCWATGEPNNVNDNELCVKLDRSGLLADVNCNLKLPYMCYRKKTEKDNKSLCNTFSPGYQYSNVTASCHKVHSVAVTFAQAFATCHAEGGYLAIINSVEEALVLKNLLSKSPVVGVGLDANFHFIGFHDIEKENEYKTVKGETLEEAGFSQFAPGEPNHVFGNEYCGSIQNASGQLNDKDCNSTIGFVCEVDINEACRE